MELLGHHNGKAEILLEEALVTDQLEEARNEMIEAELKVQMLEQRLKSLAAKKLALATTPPTIKRKRNDEVTTSLKRSRSEPGASAPAIRVANEVLKKHFRIPSFRLKQEAAIARLLDGESAVVVFPTGGGKSLVRAQCA